MPAAGPRGTKVPFAERGSGSRGCRICARREGHRLGDYDLVTERRGGGVDEGRQNVPMLPSPAGRKQAPMRAGFVMLYFVPYYHQFSIQ